VDSSWSKSLYYLVTPRSFRHSIYFQVSRFQLETPKLIQNLEDAIVSIDTGEPEDILNEVSSQIPFEELTLSRISKLSLNSNKSHLAFTMDSGLVGVIDISNNAITKMETKHESVRDAVPRIIFSAVLSFLTRSAQP